MDVTMASFVVKDDYHQIYQVFLKRCIQREGDLACLRQNLPTALQKLQLAGKDKKRFNVLSIGAGDGFVDHEIVKIVEDGYLNAENHMENTEILITGIEPMHMCANQYKESFVSSSLKLPINIDLKHMTFESYVHTRHEKNQYDLIHAIHSFYYILDFESALNHCYHHELRDNGLIVCIVAAPDDLMSRIGRVAKKDPLFSLRNADHIANVAEKYHWDFARFSCPVTYDITGIVKEKPEEGKMFLDFLTHENNFMGTADQETIDKVYKLFQDASLDEDDNKRSLVKDFNELIVISKK